MPFRLSVVLLLVHRSLAACTFRTHPEQALLAPGATRLPLPAESAEQDCALAAYAFGYDSAAFGAFHVLCRSNACAGVRHSTECIPTSLCSPILAREEHGNNSQSCKTIISRDTPW